MSIIRTANVAGRAAFDGTATLCAMCIDSIRHSEEKCRTAAQEAARDRKMGNSFFFSSSLFSGSLRERIPSSQQYFREFCFDLGFLTRLEFIHERSSCFGKSCWNLLKLRAVSHVYRMNLFFTKLMKSIKTSLSHCSPLTQWRSLTVGSGKLVVASRGVHFGPSSSEGGPDRIVAELFFFFVQRWGRSFVCVCWWRSAVSLPREGRPSGSGFWRSRVFSHWNFPIAGLFWLSLRELCR